MKLRATVASSTFIMAIASVAFAQDAIKVTVDNFVRAESDMYFGAIAKDNGFGKFHHTRELAPVDAQNVIRLNRDTLYSSAVFDLDAGPVTVTMPESEGRFISLQVISEDHYTPAVIYKSGKYTFSKEDIGTRYVAMAVRTFVNPADKEDIAKAHALQDKLVSSQANGSGTLQIPNWDHASQKTVRDALLVLNSTVPDTNGMFGKKEEVSPVRHLIGAASGWGGNPEKEATYLNVTPAQNDGKTVYKLVVKDVPVDGFWSISIYNAEGYYKPNNLNAYTLNNITAKVDTDGSVPVQFGGCDGKAVNCLPIMKGWNYMVRLYRPRAEILSGKWKFPEAQPIN